MSSPRWSSGSKMIHHPPGPPRPRSNGPPISMPSTELARACGAAGRGWVWSVAVDDLGHLVRGARRGRPGRSPGAERGPRSGMPSCRALLFRVDRSAGRMRPGACRRLVLRPGRRRMSRSCPQVAEVEGDRVERTDAHRLVVLRGRDEEPTRRCGVRTPPASGPSGRSATGARRPRARRRGAFPGGRTGGSRARAPRRPSPGARVKNAVSGYSGMRSRRQAREVRDEDILAEMKFRLVDDPPSARAAASAVERRIELASEDRACDRVRGRRPWMGMERAVDDLGHLVRGRV